MTDDAADPAKTSFPAQADARTRLLILGSLPGEASLRATQYYAHPQNQFWRLLEPVVGHTLAGEPYDRRLDILRQAGIGLWDVIASARRAGSLDAAIRDPTPNSLAAFAATLPRLRAIAFNGAKAAQIGRRELGADIRLDLIDLPSSSPAHASVPFGLKQAAWLALKPFLPEGDG